MEDPNHINYFGITDYRNRETNFGIRTEDRARHVYIIGKTGTGKSTLLENMAVQDILDGNGLACIDPHGNMAEKLLDYIPESRLNDVIYFAPFDLDHPIAFNVMEDIGADKRHLVASGLMSVFKKIWADAWSARMEYILNNTILALLEYPGATLLAVNRMLSDKEYRLEVISHVTDIGVKSFWENEFANYTERMAAEAVPAIQNKIGQFTANPLIRNIIGQGKSSFDIRELMDKKKILIINLSKGRIGEQNTNLLGGLIITKIYLAAMSRAEMTDQELKAAPSFYFYVDEFQNFANESFADILSEARKYKLALTVANQYVAQMVDEVRDAILGNVGTLITFRIGPSDAELFEKEFAPTFTAQDLVNLNFAQIYLRLMINRMSSQPFSARTMPPIQPPVVSLKPLVIEASQRNYAVKKEEVEASMKAMFEFTKKEKKDSKKKDFGTYPPKTTQVPAPSPEQKFPPASSPKPAPVAPPANNAFKKAFAVLNVNKDIIPEAKIVEVKTDVTPAPLPRPSEKLQKILAELEDSPTPEYSAKQPSTSLRPLDGLPLKTLAKDKSASDDKVNALREALQKVQATVSDKEAIPTPAKPPLAKTTIHQTNQPFANTDKREPVETPANTKAQKNVPEIPEAVLRDVLDKE